MSLLHRQAPSTGAFGRSATPWPVSRRSRTGSSFRAGRHGRSLPAGKRQRKLGRTSADRRASPAARLDGLTPSPARDGGRKGRTRRRGGTLGRRRAGLRGHARRAGRRKDGNAKRPGSEVQNLCREPSPRAWVNFPGPQAAGRTMPRGCGAEFAVRAVAKAVPDAAGAWHGNSVNATNGP